MITVRSTPGASDPVWDAAPWLDGLRDVPPEGTWPRFMTLPHPRAVGSYGPEVEAVHAAISGGGVLRWWQRLAAHRILEHDADGLLVWPEYLVTVARQVGKSWLMRALAMWRLQRGTELWGEQLIAHTGRDKGVVLEVARPAISWAEAHGLRVSRNNGREGIGLGPTMEAGSRWLLLALEAVYGKGATNGLVDEGWDVRGAYVDEGISPTLVEQTSPQLGLYSTAHRKATGLMLDRRAAALVTLEAPDDTLMLEWSPPAGTDRADRAGWRAASPHWSTARERMVARAHVKVLRGVSVDPEEPDPIASFDAQWLNVWPGAVVVEARNPDEPLVDEAGWAACLDVTAEPDPTGSLFLAVEDELGSGSAAAAAAVTPDGRIVAGGWRFADRREALDWVQDVGEPAADPLLLVGASFVDDPELEGIDVPVEPAGAAETRTALPLLRELVRTGRIAHDGGEDTAKAVTGARVKPGTAGAAMLLTGNASTALVRCLGWAVQRAYLDRL